MDSSPKPEPYPEWKKEDYDAALRHLRRNPVHTSKYTEEDIQYDNGKLQLRLEKLGILEDAQTLFDNDVNSLHELVTWSKIDFERLGLKGTVEQYTSLYESALEGCATGYASGDCNDIKDTDLALDNCVKRLEFALQYPRDAHIWRYGQNEVESEETFGQKRKSEVLEQGVEA